MYDNGNGQLKNGCKRGEKATQEKRKRVYLNEIMYVIIYYFDVYVF